MKKWLVILCVVWLGPLRAQSFEAQQLLLNVEKLAQFKQILQDLKRGYEIVAKGYTTIRDISQGNFKLHDLFLDALCQVSPAVREYQRVAEVISLQLKLVREYKAYWKRFREQGGFSVEELEHIEKVYANLFKASLKNLEDLLLVLTPRSLRMSDAERLHAIDEVYASINHKVAFLRQFNSSTTILATQRRQEQHDVDAVRKLYNIK